MGLVTKVLSFIFSIGSAYLLYNVYDILKDDPVPHLPEVYWGPSSQRTKLNLEDISIHPFKIDISPTVLKDLKYKLKNELESFAQPLEGIGFEYGFNTDYLKEIVTHWIEKYNWTERQNYLNRYPHFKTKISGLDIHFQHVKPKIESNQRKTLPLLLLHGYPGSFVEYQKIIKYFEKPENSQYDFELIIPSLPGYGFSDPAAKPGMGTPAIAKIMDTLMTRLGHEKYYILGEDWGFVIVTEMGTFFPERVKALHASCYSFHPRDTLKQMLLSYLYPSGYFTQKAMKNFHPYSKMMGTNIRESGYLHIQSTKPDTVGVALTHSPSGLAAYILEKWATWTDIDLIHKKDGGLTNKFTLDELLDNVMVYWLTGSITSAMRLYKEYFNPISTDFVTYKVPCKAPTACILSPQQIYYTSEVTLSSKYNNVQQFTHAKEGGHFTAYEAPKVVAEDAIKFFNQIESQNFK